MQNVPPRTLFLAFCLALICLTPAASAQGSASTRGVSVGWCVSRWNQLRMSPPRTLAVVEAGRGCTVLLGYPMGRAPASGCGRHSVRYLDRCIDQVSVFQCTLNRFGAYGCWTHAGPEMHPHWNALVDRGRRLVLRREPRRRVVAPVPAWARRYPFARGYIKPWTEQGVLRPGLEFTGTHGADECWPGSEVLARRWRCGDVRGSFGADPCFPRPGRPHVLACAEAPGRTRFLRVKSRTLM
jgi:hypothetical protein